jgi:hypothetical protein
VADGLSDFDAVKIIIIDEPHNGLSFVGRQFLSPEIERSEIQSKVISETEPNKFNGVVQSGIFRFRSFATGRHCIALRL